MPTATKIKKIYRLPKWIHIELMDGRKIKAEFNAAKWDHKNPPHRPWLVAWDNGINSVMGETAVFILAIDAGVDVANLKVA